LKCRHCHAPLSLPFIDLGSAPVSNAFLSKQDLQTPEARYPLRVLTCTECWLVQTEDCVPSPELFSESYPYFSSFSTSWLQHAERYVAAMVEQFGLGKDSLVVEVASNDGYLLQYVKQRGVPCLGVEPTASTARAASARGIEVIEEFFGTALARKLAAAGRHADLTAANNVLAHVPDINDFVAGFSLLLKPHGVATFEFPHLLRQVQFNQFDTIYHEHFSYLSLTAVQRIFARNGLALFDVEELPTHGGSLRVYAQRSDSGRRETATRVRNLFQAESNAGIATEGFYAGFQISADRVRDDFLAFLQDAKNSGKSTAAYGAAAKGNTLINYAGIGPDLIKFVVDRNPAKQGKFMPGSHIPIVDERRLQMEKPDYIVILPWNLKSEIIAQLEYVKTWHGTIVTAVPRLEMA
jgi:SAM-dependent methyltransferase